MQFLWLNRAVENHGAQGTSHLTGLLHILFAGWENGWLTQTGGGMKRGLQGLAEQQLAQGPQQKSPVKKC